MMNKALFALAVVGGIVLTTPETASAQRRFRAVGTGDQEVPPNDSAARSISEVHFMRVGPFALLVHTRLDLGLQSRITAAHIHVAPEGQNGPVALTLGRPRIQNRRFALTVSFHFRTDGDATLERLHELMVAGQTYVNVHTQDFPDGETRGQLSHQRD